MKYTLLFLWYMLYVVGQYQWYFGCGCVVVHMPHAGMCWWFHHSYPECYHILNLVLQWQNSTEWHRSQDMLTCNLTPSTLPFIHRLWTLDNTWCTYSQSVPCMNKCAWINGLNYLKLITTDVSVHKYIRRERNLFNIQHIKCFKWRAKPFGGFALNISIDT